MNSEYEQKTELYKIKIWSRDVYLNLNRIT